MSWDNKQRRIYKKAVIDGVTYMENDIVEIEIHDSIIDDSTLKIGTVISSKCSIKLRVDIDVADNAKVEPFISLDYVEWEPLGEFYIDNRSKEDKFLTLNCFDKLYEAGKQFTTNTNLMMNGVRFENPVSISEIFQDICNALNVNTNVVLIENDVLSKYVEIPSYTMTMRDMLSHIAVTQGACFKMSRVGLLKLIKFDSNIKKIYDRSMYSECTEVNLFKNITSVYINDIDQRTYMAPYRIGIYGLEDMSLKSFFMNELAYNWNTEIENQLPIQYTPLNMVTRGDPSIKVGDKIQVELKDGRLVETYVLKSHLKIRFGLSQVIESPSDTVQESEFGRFDIVEQLEKTEGQIRDAQDKVEDLGKRTDRVEDEVGIDPEDEGKFFNLTISGNAEEGVHYLLLIGSDTQNFPRDQIPFGTSVDVKPIGSNRIYINGKYRQIGIGLYIWGDTELNISTNVSDSLDLPKIWIESQEPTNEGKDGDIWVVI